jgi:hypothetical protein
MSTYEPLEGMVFELTRRGLPPEYALRATYELVDHHRDLVEELKARGWTETHAVQEASRRLGIPRQLVKETVREYQRRYWCARWPLITFVLGPLPAFFLVCFLTGFVAVAMGKLLEKGAAPTPIETWIEYTVAYSAKIWLTLVAPVLVVSLFCWLAKRAALAHAWPCLASLTIAVFVAFVQCTFSIHPSEAHASVFMVGYHFWFLPECWNASLLRFFWNPWQLAQLVLPLAVTGVLLLYFSRRIARDSLSFRTAG